MTASDALGVQFKQFTEPVYHGSDVNLVPGQSIEPGHTPNFGLSDPDKIYMSDDMDHAATYGAHVYEVHPTGPVHGSGNDITSAHPAMVKQKINMNDHWVP